MGTRSTMLQRLACGWVVLGDPRHLGFQSSASDPASRPGCWPTGRQRWKNHTVRRLMRFFGINIDSIYMLTSIYDIHNHWYLFYMFVPVESIGSFFSKENKESKTLRILVSAKIKSCLKQTQTRLTMEASFQGGIMLLPYLSTVNWQSSFRGITGVPLAAASSNGALQHPHSFTHLRST